MGGHERAHTKRQGKSPTQTGYAGGVANHCFEAGRPGFMSSTCSAGCVVTELVRVKTHQSSADAAAPGTVRQQVIDMEMELELSIGCLGFIRFVTPFIDVRNPGPPSSMLLLPVSDNSRRHRLIPVWYVQDQNKLVKPPTQTG